MRRRTPKDGIVVIGGSIFQKRNSPFMKITKQNYVLFCNFRRSGFFRKILRWMTF